MSTVDVHQLRCAVATLVCAAQAESRLDRRAVRRIDAAVAVLSTARAPHRSGRSLGEAIDRLLTPATDPDGARTMAAIDEMAHLTHVEPADAPALAAELLSPTLRQLRMP